MKIRISLLGAGGKMGCRLTRNLRSHPGYRIDYHEVSPMARQRLTDDGLVLAEPDALALADIVILAVPDRAIAQVSADVVPRLRPGAMLVGLDPAAAHADVVTHRDDLTYFVAHPCHPPIFGDMKPADATTDWFGGDTCPQSVVCALHHGPEADYAKGERLAAAMFAPILRMHRITVAQMAVLEPAVVESTMICCLMVAKQAMDRACELGVPRAAVEDFCLGHLRTEIAIVFGFAGFPFSDGAMKAVQQNMRRIFRDDWQNVLTPEAIAASVRDITTPTEERG